MNKTDKAWRLFESLMRNYPLWPSTFSMCACGRESGRGGGKCRLCIIDELCEIVGKKLAIQADEALAASANAWQDIRNAVSEK